MVVAGGTSILSHPRDAKGVPGVTLQHAAQPLCVAQLATAAIDADASHAELKKQKRIKATLGAKFSVLTLVWNDARRLAPQAYRNR